MPRRVTESKTTLVKRLVDMDVALCSGKLTQEQYWKVKAKRDKLERRLYKCTRDIGS